MKNFEAAIPNNPGKSLIALKVDYAPGAASPSRTHAKSVFEHVYSDAKRRGASRVHWLTYESNHNAMQLYDRIADRAPFMQYQKQFA